MAEMEDASKGISRDSAVSWKIPNVIDLVWNMKWNLMKNKKKTNSKK